MLEQASETEKDNITNKYRALIHANTQVVTPGGDNNGNKDGTEEEDERQLVTQVITPIHTINGEQTVPEQWNEITTLTLEAAYGMPLLAGIKNLCAHRYSKGANKNFLMIPA